MIFKGYIDGVPQVTDFELKVGRIKLEAPNGSGHFLVKNLFLSCDPYMRGRMRDFHGSYIPPFVPGQVLFFSVIRFLFLVLVFSVRSSGLLYPLIFVSDSYWRM